jgi:hypothetical protein
MGHIPGQYVISVSVLAKHYSLFFFFGREDILRVQSSPSVARPFKVLAHATVTPMSDPDRIVK